MISDHPEIDDSDLVAQLLERQHNPADSRDGGGRVDVLLANGEEIGEPRRLTLLSRGER
jgi:hypothetical protein